MAHFANTPTPEEQWAARDSEVRVRWASPHVLVITAEGVLSPAAAAFIVGATRRAMSEGVKLTLFCDGEQLNAWDSETRKQLTEMLLMLRDHGGRASILVKSKMIGTALWAFGLARGLPLRTFSDQAEFQQALAFAANPVQAGAA